MQPWKDTCAQTFVKAFDSISVKNMVLGEAFAIGTHAVFVSDAGADGSDDLGQVIAHEIGHALGLNHNANGINGQLGCPGVTLSNDQPANPFIDYANGDSDATDESKPLMWCKSGGDHTHLGSPAWFQLNQANPVGP